MKKWKRWRERLYYRKDCSGKKDDNVRKPIKLKKTRNWIRSWLTITAGKIWMNNKWTKRKCPKVVLAPRVIQTTTSVRKVLNRKDTSLDCNRTKTWQTLRVITSNNSSSRSSRKGEKSGWSRSSNSGCRWAPWRTRSRRWSRRTWMRASRSRISMSLCKGRINSSMRTLWE